MSPRTVKIFRENNDFQHADVLRRNRQKRQAYREFFLEGVRPINLAIEHRWSIHAFFSSEERGLSDWARNILRHSTAIVHYDLPARLLEKLSNKSEASELIAIVAMPPDDLSRVPLGDNPLVVVFDRPSSPGNLGTLIRSSDSLGVNGLIVAGHGVDLYDPETISASRGSLFALPSVRIPGPKELLPWLERTREQFDRLQVFAADEAAENALWQQDFRLPSIVLLGNEKWGLSAALRAAADVRVRIPMSGVASSLNVAVAGSIILYEISRQRGTESDARTPGRGGVS